MEETEGPVSGMNDLQRNCKRRSISARAKLNATRSHPIFVRRQRRVGKLKEQVARVSVKVRSGSARNHFK